MSEECTHDCSSCGAACSSRDAAPKYDAPNPNSSVKKVIGVVSGKGGVGKSMTSALLACAMARRGYHCGILDADITGPSIPKAFGLHEQIVGSDDGGDTGRCAADSGGSACDDQICRAGNRIYHRK